MKTLIMSLTMVFVGLLFGLTLTELSLRTFMPELVSAPLVDTGYIKNVGEGAETPHKTGSATDLDETSWLALGGSTAFGVGIPEGERFSERIEATTGLKILNAATVGAEGDVEKEFAAATALNSQARKAVYVVDMGVPPHVLLGEAAAETETKEGFFANLALAKVLEGRNVEVAQTIPAWTASAARNYAAKLAKASAKYRQTNEHFIVLVAPARGHYFENSYGTIHRNNQKLMAEAVRSFQGIYAVDLSYLIKLDYANPEILFDAQNRLNATGHRMLASGFLKQFEAFSTWRSFDELSPEEQAKVREDMRKTQEEEARKKAQRPF